MFVNHYIGINDRKGNRIYNGNTVLQYHKGEFVKCTIVYVPEWAMFAVKWPDGYINKWPVNGDALEVIEP